MQIVVNGAACEFDGATVAELLDNAEVAAPFAVAVNTVFVPKSDYVDCHLHAGDAVEIVQPVVGG
ncbi:sulfur carrier protein ThiS [Snodgrassella sp. CFCC 13594]|uniref:sulfur carrier protein ThiS n=1 Tax=Snodgrassella sp. CFCC 13594 TaxID=1775559 RepID=UPI000831EEBB|nr:sulfur carrier protein ThiS [Snodgrassella sp. CFCC 13594]